LASIGCHIFRIALSFGSERWWEGWGCWFFYTRRTISVTIWPVALCLMCCYFKDRWRLLYINVLVRICVKVYMSCLSELGQPLSSLWLANCIFPRLAAAFFCNWLTEFSRAWQLRFVCSSWTVLHCHFIWSRLELYKIVYLLKTSNVTTKHVKIRLTVEGIKLHLFTCRYFFNSTCAFVCFR